MLGWRRWDLVIAIQAQCADGAPNAYHPDNSGLDDLSNAGTPGRWEGLAKDADGEPIIQGPNDPFPGYYVSATALADRTKPVNDPTRYVDASKIPFIVLPGAMARQIGARPGRFQSAKRQEFLRDLRRRGTSRQDWRRFHGAGRKSRNPVRCAQWRCAERHFVSCFPGIWKRPSQDGR